MVRDEDVLGDHAVAAGGLHPGDEPGFLVLQVAARDQRQPLVDGLALLVGDRDAQHRPAGVPGAGVVIPAAADPVPAVGLAGLGGRGEHAADQRVGVLAPHVVLGLLRVQADHPGAHVQQRCHPGGAAVGLAERGRHVEHGAHRGLVAPVPLRLGDLEDARLAQRLDAVLGHAAVLLTPGGVLADQRLQFLHPGDELTGAGDPGRLGGGRAVGHGGHIRSP